MKRTYGYIQDRPDERDFKLSIGGRTPTKTVYLFDTKNTPPVYDQGQLGSCVSNAVGAQAQFFLMNKDAAGNPKAKLFFPSRLFIYYFGRVIEGTVTEDSGMTIRDGIKILASRGICQEEKWPYVIPNFAVEPPKEAQDQALKFEAMEYYRVSQTRKSIVGALLKGYPVAFGFKVYESFESDEVAQTGEVPMPSVGETFLGGHAVTIWGYNQEKDYFLVRNSWGKNWGLNGYFHMPVNYVLDSSLSSDFWIVKKMETGK